MAKKGIVIGMLIIVMTMGFVLVGCGGGSGPAAEAKKMYQIVLDEDVEAYTKLLPAEVLEQAGSNAEAQVKMAISFTKKALTDSGVTSVEDITLTEAIDGDTATVTATAKASGEELAQSPWKKVDGTWRMNL
jgi:ribosome-associated toxin RatA of RatAB toxin-antitoxin module